MLACLAAVLAIHLLPRVVLGERSIITILDTLDSDFLYHVLIAKPGRMWSYSAQIPELLGGLPREVYPSPAKLSSILFWVFPPFTAYVMLDLAVHAIAFLGMHALLRDVFGQRLREPQRLMIAVAYALLSFYVIYDASVAAQPMVAWALFNLRRGQRLPAAFAALFSFGFISVLPTSGAFVVAAAGLVALGSMLQARKLQPVLVAGVVVLIGGCLASDPWFVRTMLAPPYVSHRSAWLAPGSSKVFDWGDVLSRAEVTFLDGRYHSTSVHGPILSATLGTLGVELIRRRGRRAAQLLGVIALTYLLALADPLGSWQGMRPVWDAFPFLRTVHVRFHWFLPTIWFVTLAWIVTIWCREWRSFRVTAPLVTAFLLFVAGNVFVSKTQASNDTIQSYEAMFAQWRGKRTRDLSYSEFVAHDLFDSIDRYIGRPKESYRVASIGIHPAVAALNGFQTIDGYHDNYPLAYKQRLRRLIRFELAKDRRQRHMFEDWGSRAYVLFAKQDMSQLSRRQRNKPIETRDITLDPYAATDLHLSYVFSAYPLSFPLRSGLVFAREFHDSVAAWRVFLYRQLPMLGAL